MVHLKWFYFPLHLNWELFVEVLVHDARRAPVVHINVIHVVSPYKTYDNHKFISFLVIVDVIPFIKHKLVSIPFDWCLIVHVDKTKKTVAFPGGFDLSLY